MVKVGKEASVGEGHIVLVVVAWSRKMSAFSDGSRCNESKIVSPF
jgi:hypothetical protein